MQELNPDFTISKARVKKKFAVNKYFQIKISRLDLDRISKQRVIGGPQDFHLILKINNFLLNFNKEETKINSHRFGEFRGEKPENGGGRKRR